MYVPSLIVHSGSRLRKALTSSIAAMDSGAAISSAAMSTDVSQLGGRSAGATGPVALHDSDAFQLGGSSDGTVCMLRIGSFNVGASQRLLFENGQEPHGVPKRKRCVQGCDRYHYRWSGNEIIATKCTAQCALSEGHTESHHCGTAHSIAAQFKCTPHMSGLADLLGL